MKYKNKLAICENCDDEVSYEVKKIKKTYIIRGISFEVEIKQAYCNQCHNPVFPYDISKENDIIIYDAYKRLKGLLTSSEIVAIRKKRKMSQQDLARFIKCGEKNIARYENGAIQDEVFDNLIRMVDNDDIYFAMRKYYGKPETHTCELFIKPNIKNAWETISEPFAETVNILLTTSKNIQTNKVTVKREMEDYCSDYGDSISSKELYIQPSSKFAIGF